MDTASVDSTLSPLAVLAVDDHAINREFLRAGLGDSVARLDVVDSGPAAIECCRRRVYDVILMDLHMPQMDGLATIHRIRDLDTHSARTRMVILTADARPEERMRLLAEGFDAYLNKPLSIIELKRALWGLFAPAQAHSTRTESHQTGSEPLIDPDRVDAVALGNPDTAADLGRMLSRELEQKLPLLDQMLAERQIDQAAALLHQWTGAGGFAGALRFSRECGILRRRLLDPATSSTGAAYLQFLRIAHATRQALETGMGHARTQTE